MDEAPSRRPMLNRFGQSTAGILARVVSSSEFLAATLSLAASLRVAHILALRRLPLFDGLIIDSWVYDDVARRIAAGDWMGGDHAFYHDPLYSYFLAGIYILFGRDLLLVRLIQAALGVATCALIAVIGRRIAGRTVGHLAALFFAIYKPALFNEGEFEKTALGVFLVAVALAMAIHPSLWARFGAGAALALAALARGNLLLLAPLGALYFLTEPGPAPPGEAQGSGVVLGWCQRLALHLRSHSTRSAIVFLFSFLVVLAPVAWRNHRVSGEWIPTKADAGQAFYMGNNPANASGGWQHIPFVRSDALHEEADFRAAAEARLGRRLTPSEVSIYWFKEAWRHILAHPAFAARVMFKKFTLFWSNYEVPDAWDMYFLARYSPVLRLPLLGMGWLLPLAVLGAIAGFRERREVRLLVGFVAVYSLGVVGFFVFSRFRLYVVPSLAVLAAIAVPSLADVVRSHDIRRGAPAVIGAAAVAAFSFFGVRTFDVGKAENVQSFISLSLLYQQKGDLVSAERLLGEALETAPRNAATLCGMGLLHFRAGRLTQADGYLSRCVAADPLYPDAWYLLGQVYDAYGNPAVAAQAYRKQLEILPDDAKTERLLAEDELRTGSIKSAVDRLAGFVARQGEDPRVNLTMAVALFVAGRAEDAQAVLQRSAARGWPASKQDLDQEYARLFGGPPRS
jgi:tetratricopeptide (TPR) repeat protein